MKNIYYRNWWGLALTLPLYFTIWLGVILHLTTGVYQVGVAIYLFCNYDKLSKVIKFQLYVYSILVIMTILSPLLIINPEYLIYFWGFTWVLFFYFTGIVYQTLKLNS